jgi:hypothetical protein
MANWLDKYEQGGLVLKKKTKDNYGTKHNPNDVKVSVGPNFVGLGYNTKGRNYSPAWGGQFQMGGSLPGSVGFMYARTQNPAPSNGKYAKKTQASAQNGQEMKYYQDGLDFKPKSISQDGRNISKELKKEAEEKLKKMNKPKATISQYTPKAGEAERLDKEKLQRIEDSYKLLNKLASSKHTTKAMENIVEPMIAMEMGVGAGKLIGKGAKALAKKAYKVNPWAEKLMNPNMGYRIADEASYQDFMSSGYVRPKSLTPEFQSKTFNNFTEAMADRPTSFPSFAKGEPAWDYLPKEGKGYIYATEQPLVRRGDINPITGVQVKGRHWAYRPIDENTGKVITELPADKVKVYSSEPHWLRGYEEVAKPTSTQEITRGPIPAPYKGTTLPYDNIGYKEPATGELAPYLTPEFETIPYSELPKTMYHGGPSVIVDIDAIKTMREGLPIQSATSPTSRGFYTTPNTWMRMEGSPNPLREVEGFYDRNMAESAENYAMGRGDAYIHAGEINPEANIVDWKTFSNLEPVKGLGPDFRKLSPEAAKIAEDLGIHGIRDVSEYNILNPQKAFKSFKPAYKNLGKGWERYAKGGIVDPMGQWAHPGEVTTIPSNDITMKGVDYDVLGVSDTGDTKLMKPGKNYKFKGNSVTEYPKGGWLNKYK